MPPLRKEFHGQNGMSEEFATKNDTKLPQQVPSIQNNTDINHDPPKHEDTPKQSKETLTEAVDSQESRMEAMRRACWGRHSVHSLEDLTWNVRDHVHVHDEYKVSWK